MSETTPRRIVDVIAQIKAKLPEDKQEEHRQLDRIVQNAGYRPPEFDSQTWAEIAKVVQIAVSTPLTQQWELDIVCTLMNVTEAEFREKLGANVAF